jgi:hypothetical protein
MVFETLVFSPLKHLIRLIARENLIILSRRESNKSHMYKLLCDKTLMRTFVKLDLGFVILHRSVVQNVV